MKASLIILLASFALISCSITNNKEAEREKYQDLDMSTIDTNDILIAKSPDDPDYELGSLFAFVNSKNDTIIPKGKYYATWTDTLKTFAIVSGGMNGRSGIIGIDRDENLLFEVFYFDNGPDELREGLFRIIRNSKIGYANGYGEVVIPCQFDCAYYFENGKAKVSKNCREVKDYPFHRWESEAWYYIDYKGKRIE